MAIRNIIIKVIILAGRKYKIRDVVPIPHYNDGLPDDTGVLAAGITRIHWKIKLKPGVAATVFDASGPGGVILPPASAGTFGALVVKSPSHICVDLTNTNPEPDLSQWYKYTLRLVETVGGAAFIIDPMLQYLAEE